MATIALEGGYLCPYCRLVQESDNITLMTTLVLTALGIVNSPAGDAQRKICSSCISVLKNLGFGSRAVMEQRIQEEVTSLLQHIQSMGGKAWYPASILEHCTMNVIYNLMFATRFSYDDPEGTKLVSLNRNLAESLNAILDVFPLLARLPFYKRKLAEISKLYEQFLNFCQTKVEESINDTISNFDNFFNKYIKISLGETTNTRELAFIMRDLIMAGSETTSGQLNWALILLANHPDVQSRLQQEIDSVVPRDRLPSLDDKPRLIHLEAVILEVHGLETGVPLSIPRLIVAKTELGGYKIPSGTEILVNLWSAHMDPHLWDQPEKFNPDRLLNESGQTINRDLMIAFSHGKRSYLGEILARQEMFLFLSALVQQFNILPSEGELKVKDDATFARTLTAVRHTLRLVARQL